MKKSMSADTNNAKKRKADQDLTPCDLLKKSKSLSDAVPKVTQKGSDAVTKVTKKGSDAEPKDNKTTFITIDLETTGLIRGNQYPHITQIAAIEIDTSKSFSTYVLPKLPLDPFSQSMTGVVVTGNKMEVNGQTVKHDSIENALQKLFEWLDNFPNVVLVAHNGGRFDFPVMISALVNTNTADVFLDRVTGLIDSLPLFKEQFPGQRSYKQVNLAQSLLDISYDAHNAIYDVETLGKLVKFTKLSPEELVTHMKLSQEFLDSFMAQRNSKK